MPTPIAVKRALNHVHELFPSVVAVLFSNNGNSVYLDEAGHNVEISSEKLDLNLLSDAMRAVHHKPEVYKWVEPEPILDQDLVKFLEGVVGCVEADNYASHQLWAEHHHHAEKLGYRKLSWKQGGVGTGRIIGYVQVNGEDMPVNVTMFVNEVDGQRILFYDPCSRCVDHDMVRKWLTKVLPETAFREDGYINNTDATNFTNILRR